MTRFKVSFLCFRVTRIEFEFNLTATIFDFEGLGTVVYSSIITQPDRIQHQPQRQVFHSSKQQRRHFHR